MFRASSHPRLLRLASAALAGALLVVAPEPWLAPSAFLSLCGLCLALASAARAGVGEATACGLLFGFMANSVALDSLFPLLRSFARLPTLLALTLALLAWLLQALPYALAGLTTGVVTRFRVAPLLSIPPALVLALSVTPQLLPWHFAALSVGWVQLVQVAELGGESLVGLCVSAIAASGCATFVASTSRKRLLGAALALLVSCATLGYGGLRRSQIERLRAAAPTLVVGVVQSNVGIAQKHDPGRAAAILAGLRKQTMELERLGVGLTVWGETAYPYPLVRESRWAPRDARKIVGDGVRGPVLSGLETFTQRHGVEHKFNSAQLFLPDGALGPRADKSRLLAFGEYVPLYTRLPLLQRRYRSPGFRAGNPALVRAAESSIGVLICYEDLFPDAARRQVALGAELLVNLTNDAWFGPSREPRLHDVAARLRAVETRRDLVRAVNTGVSSFTTASGEVLVRTPIFRPASFVAVTRKLSLSTFYLRAGEWVAPLCALVLLALAMHGRARQRDP